MASTKQRDIMDSNPRTGNSEKLPKIGELFNQISLGKDFKQLRLLGGFASYATHWIEIKGAKTGKETKIPRVCLNYNSETDSIDDNGCPYCKAGSKAPVKYLFNVIDRDEQEDLGKKEPKYSKSEIKKGVLETGSRAKTPIYVLQLPPGQVERLKKYSKLNKVKGKETSVTDEEYGIDLSFSFDAEAKGNNYDIQKAERTPLSSKEKKLLLWDIGSIGKVFEPKSVKEAKADFEELKKVMVDAGDDDEYSKDDSKKSKKKKSKKDDSDISDSDVSDSSDSDASDSDSSSKSKSKKSKKSKKDDSDNSDASDSDLGSDVDSDTSDSDSDSDKKKNKKGKKSKKDDSDNSDASDSDTSDSDSSDASDSDTSDTSDSDSDSDKKKSKKDKKSSKKSKKDESDNSDIDSDASEASDNDSDSDSDSDSSSKKKSKKSSKKDSKKSSKKKRK